MQSILACGYAIRRRRHVSRRSEGPTPRALLGLAGVAAGPGRERPASRSTCHAPCRLLAIQSFGNIDTYAAEAVVSFCCESTTDRTYWPAPRSVRPRTGDAGAVGADKLVGTFELEHDPRYGLRLCVADWTARCLRGRAAQANVAVAGLEDSVDRVSTEVRGSIEVIRIGRHVIQMEPDIFYAAGNGDISAADASAFFDALEQFKSTRERFYYLIDLSNVGALEPAARKVMVQDKRGVGNDASAFFGASFPVRVLFTLIMKAAALLSEYKLVFAFCASEAEARAFLDERRRVGAGAAASAG